MTDDVHNTRQAEVVGPFAYRFTPSPVAARVARYVLAAWLEHLPGADVDGIDDLLVVCSELCANAVTHSRGGDLSVELRGRVDGDAVILDVIDAEGSFGADGRRRSGARPDVNGLDPAGEGGRGLFIVAALTDGMTIDVEDGRTLVRVRKRGMVRHVGAPSDASLSQRFQARNGVQGNGQRGNGQRGNGQRGNGQRGNGQRNGADH